MMTPDKLNAELLKVVKSKIPEGTNIANLLMDMLSIGKEAIYRRFRGEVPFTFSEAMIISRQLGVSLDQLNGIANGGENLLDLNLSQSENSEKAYLNMVEHYLYLLNSIVFHPENTMWEISNRISHLFDKPSSSLTRFELFKWLYQHEKTNNKRLIRKYEDIYVPTDLRIKEKEIAKELIVFPRSYFIWDNMIFQSVIGDIQYFKELNLISSEGLQELKTDLLLLIDKLEEVATNGHYANGNEVQIYISNINFGISSSYIETVEQNLCFIKLYNLNMITSSNEAMFENMKVWVQSMKRFSVLISQSADMFRYKFFQQQREHVNRL